MSRLPTGQIYICFGGCGRENILKGRMCRTTKRLFDTHPVLSTTANSIVAREESGPTDVTVMPSDAKVFLYYGPYMGACTVDYRQSRLQGLKTILNKAGHTVEMRPFRDWNVVELWVNGEKVFKCDIRNLDYGGDGELDPLCQEACEAVQNAY